jgi:hypothetical protein
MLTFEPVGSGEWFPTGKKRTFIACCDCGLVHQLEFAIIDEWLWMRGYRDYTKTRTQRKKKRYAFTRRRST